MTHRDGLPRFSVSGLYQLNWTHTTTSGGLATPPFGSLFPSPRGVGKACRGAAIARASPPAEETGKAIVWVQFS